MAGESSTGPGPPGGPDAGALPPQIIAQAEAAIAANTPDQAKPSYSQHQDSLRKTSSRDQAASSSSA